jgi:hypothetical protein
VAVGYFLQVPGWVRRTALYHAVFYELLPHSPEPAADLARLGLPSDYLRYSGTTAYSPNTGYWAPEVQKALESTTGYDSLALFYLERPARAISVARRAAEGAAHMRPPRFGNFAKEEGGPPRELSRRFALWSDLRLALRPVAAAWPPILLIGTLAACLRRLHRSAGAARLAREGLAALCVIATVEFLVCAFADAHIELIRHLYLYFAAADLVLVADAIWLAQLVASRRLARRITEPASA